MTYLDISSDIVLDTSSDVHWSNKVHGATKFRSLDI